MKLHVIGFVGSVALATAFLAAQEPRGQAPSPAPGGMDQNKPPAASTAKPADTTLTGCLIQGSSPTVFILENARKSATDKTEKGATFKLASAGEDLGFQKHLNHEVTITGSSEKAAAAGAPPAAGKADESALPVLSAKSLTMVADKCTAPTH